MSGGKFDLDRRSVALAVIFGGAAALPAVARAQDGAPQSNVVFTGADPGHWGAGVAAKHVPIATVAGGVLSVKTPHPMSAAHYIVSHSVVLAGGQFLGRKTFTPADTPESSFALPAGYSGAVTVTSTCNLHDFWMTTLSV